MNSRSEIERTLDGFFAEGPETVADQALVRTFDAIDRTKQRRDLLAPWRFSLMSVNSRLATMMLVAAIAIGGGAYLLGQRSGVAAPLPTPTVAPTAQAANPTAARTPAPSPTLDPSTWPSSTSAIYGFSAAHPFNWSEQPATGHSASSPGGDANPDIYWSPSGWPEFKGYEIKIPAGKTAATFLQAYTADAVQTACYQLPNQWTETTVDGHLAHIAYAGCNEHFYFAQATVVIGQRIWFFELDGPDRLLIVPFLTTVKIDPSKVVD